MNRRKTPSALFTVFVLLPLLFSVPAAAGNDFDVVESETGFYYTIQKGDTLWDLSKHFNDSPWLWPELWEENDQISNPHWIFPGERIRLYKKSGQQALDSQLAPPVLPVPTVAEPAAVDETPFFLYTSIDRAGFIRKPPVDPSGVLFAVQENKKLISEGDVVYIRPAEHSGNGNLIPGSRHLVFRCMAPTDDRDSQETIGTQHYITGVIEVVKYDPDLVTAKVLKSYRPIQKTDLIMPYTPRSKKISLQPSTPGIDGSIITSEEHTMLTGDFMQAFIDKGRADNIQVGQQYSIYKKQASEEDDGSTSGLPPIDFGTLLVVHTEQTTSTVVILNTANNISKGERFRTPVN